MCLISSRADLALMSQCVMSSTSADEIGTQFNVLLSTFATLSVLSRYPSSASCMVTAAGCSDSVAFPRFFFGTCCSVTLVCPSLTSRGSLFVVILLVLSDPTNSGVRSCFRLRCLLSSPHHHQCHRCCMLGSHPALVLSSFLSSRRPCQCSGLGCVPDAQHPPLETEGYGVESSCVQRNFLLRLRLEMADDTGPPQCASHSRILGCVSFNCVS